MAFEVGGSRILGNARILSAASTESMQIRQVNQAMAKACISPLMSLHGTKPTSRDVRSLVAIGGRADMALKAHLVAIDPKRTSFSPSHFNVLG
jgi:hypothetical protein